ncbi:hypothetical protein PLICRDRAFT_36268 [Plicaturopsis crispa FD-325 SS-3]|nr:hypothetical protein PLICRDRAFT_36268 [Plicaturopsis crispa FD-325 SS-3]
MASAFNRAQHGNLVTPGYLLGTTIPLRAGRGMGVSMTSMSGQVTERNRCESTLPNLNLQDTRIRQSNASSISVHP